MPPSDGNLPPVASAGDARSATVGEIVELDASSSSDPDGDILTYHWSLATPGSSTTTLANDDYVTTSIQPDIPGEYAISLVVNDGLVDSAAATVLITVGATATPQNSAPIAVVDGPATVVVGSIVRLDGTQSSDPDGDGIFFDWLLEALPEGSSVRLDDPLSPTPTFIPDLPGNYELSLMVTDGALDSASAPIIVAATAPPNEPPVADAGRDVNVATGGVVTLDASDSTDPEGATLTYRWTMASAPATSSTGLVGADTASPTLQTDVDGVYVVELIVNDGQADSAPDTVSVTAVTGNVPPNANAGSDQTVETGTLVQLDGSGSFDVDGDPLSYRWMFLSRPANSNVQLANPLSATPRFTPSAVGTFEIQLIVSDGALDSTPDVVRVTTVSPNGTPIANAGADQQARVLDSIVLDASASLDPDGDPLSFAWTFSFKPPASSAVIANQTSMIASFDPDVAGTYTVSVTVDDGRDGATDSVTFTVNEPWPQLEGDVVITEVMADPDTLGDSMGEWFELYNPTSTAWDLRGCELSDLGTDSALIGASLLVPPMSYITLARSSTPGFGPDYVYSGFSLGNGGDEIIVTCGAGEIAQVALLPAFGFASTAPTGASLSLLRDRMDETANDDGASWCVSTTDYNGDKGTPGAPNQFQTACP